MKMRAVADWAAIRRALKNVRARSAYADNQSGFAAAVGINRATVLRVEDESDDYRPTLEKIEQWISVEKGLTLSQFFAQIETVTSSDKRDDYNPEPVKRVAHSLQNANASGGAIDGDRAVLASLLDELVTIFRGYVDQSSEAVQKFSEARRALDKDHEPHAGTSDPGRARG